MAVAMKPVIPTPGKKTTPVKPGLDQAIADAMRPKPIMEPVAEIDPPTVSRPPVTGGLSLSDEAPSPIGATVGKPAPIGPDPLKFPPPTIGPGPGGDLSKSNFGSVPDYEMTTSAPAPFFAGAGQQQAAPNPWDIPQGGGVGSPLAGGLTGAGQQFGAPTGTGGITQSVEPPPSFTFQTDPFGNPIGANGQAVTDEWQRLRQLQPQLYGTPEAAARTFATEFRNDPAGQVAAMQAMGYTASPDLLQQAGMSATPRTGGSPLDQTRPFIDNLMAEYERSLNPQWEGRQRQLEQSLIGRGLRPGSEAYDTAMADFNRQRSDAFDQARRSATQQGLGAQQQFWAQGFQEQQARDAALERVNAQRNAGLAGRYQAEMAQADRDLRRQEFEEGTRRFNLGFGEDQRQFNEGTRRFDTQFGEDRFRFDTQFGEDRRRFDADRMDRLDQQDFGNLLAMLGFDRQGQIYDNDLINQDYQRTLPWFGLLPQGGPTGIDVQGPYLTQLQMQEARRQHEEAMRAQRSNSRGQAIGQIGSAVIGALLCAREMKDTIAPANIGDVASAIYSLPVDLWRYKGSEAVHLGTYAEEFNQALTNTPDLPVIKLGDVIGALIATVQSQNQRIAELEGNTEKRGPARQKKDAN